MDSELLQKKSSTKLVDNNKIYTLNFSQKRYLRSLLLIHYNIVSKVIEHFGCKSKVDQESRKHGIYLSISQDVLNNEIKNVALFLRQKILKLREVNLPNLEAIQYGQCPDVPAELSEFYRIMFTGSKN